MAILCAQVSTAKRIVQEGGETVNGGERCEGGTESAPTRRHINGFLQLYIVYTSIQGKR